MNFHRCTRILSAGRPRLFSLRNLKKQFAKSTEHLHLTMARFSSEKFWALSRRLCVLIHAHSCVWTCTIHTYKLTTIYPVKSQVGFFFSGRNCYSQNFKRERCHFLWYIVNFHSNIAGTCYQHFITYTHIYLYISSTHIFYFPEAVKISYFQWRK